MLFDNFFKKKAIVKNDIEETIERERNNEINIYDNYQLPSLSLLEQPKIEQKSTQDIKEKITNIETILSNYNIESKVKEVHVGPIYTRFEIEIGIKTNVKKLMSLKDNLKITLGVKELNIVFPIEKKNYIAIDVENNQIDNVNFREVIRNIPPKNNEQILFSLGKDMQGNPKYCDIQKCSHFLIAGTTGTGKSNFLNNIICSILIREKPDDVKLMLFDIKKIEFNLYKTIPHLYCPIINDIPSAKTYLNQLIFKEINNRLHIFEQVNVKNIKEYNKYVNLNENKLNEKYKKMPYILIVVDDIYDFSKDNSINDYFIKISQVGHKLGIHLIISTQKPSIDSVDSLIKSNLLTRIAFRTVSKKDSTIIINSDGAQNLTLNGDMLFLQLDERKPCRIKSPYISDSDINSLVNYVSAQAKPIYNVDNAIDYYDNDDKLYNEIREFVIRQGKASASLLQRRFRLGYERAAKYIDLLEQRGVIGPSNGAKPREILIKKYKN